MKAFARQSTTELIKHLPGIKRILVYNAFDAVIIYKSGLVRTLHSDESIYKLLESFLVPVRHSSDFKSILDYNRAIEGLDEVTNPCITPAS